MENKRKHLEFIQSIIQRMATNSFQLKTWVVTLISALFILSSKESTSEYFLIAYIPILTFWILDGYFLSQERLFRGLYKDVSSKNEDDIDFLMDTEKYKSDIKNTWLKSIWSVTLVWFYVPLVLIMIIIMCLIK